MDVRSIIRQSAPVDVFQPYNAGALRGRTVLITGGASGLGAAMARAWAALGAHVVVGDVDDAAGHALVAQLRSRDADAHYQRCDVTDWTQQVALFEAAVRTAALRHGIRVNMVAPYYVGGTRMLQPLIEAAYLAGSAGPASITDVVDTATRLVADGSVAGRALVVGPRLKSGQREPPIADGEGQGMSAWECYAHDYNEVEAFTWRYVHMLNLITGARGSWAWICDLCNIFRRRS